MFEVGVFLFSLEAFFFVVVPIVMAVLEPMATSTNVLIATTIVGFMTMVVQQGFSAYNARKTHRDDVESRDAKARDIAEQYRAENEKLRLQAELRAQEIRFLIEERQTAFVLEQSAQSAQLKALLNVNHEATEAVGKKLVEESKVALSTNNKLDQVHGLVNSHMTIAMERELDALRTNLLLLEQVFKLDKDTEEPTKYAKAIEAVKAKIVDLAEQIRERKIIDDASNRGPDTPHAA